MNMLDMLNDPDFAVDFQVARTLEVVTDRGRAEFSETIEPVTGSIQPATGKDRESLPDEDRQRETLAVFVPVVLSPGGEEGGGADVILWKGNRYRVAHVDDWMHTDGFCKALAVKESA